MPEDLTPGVSPFDRAAAARLPAEPLSRHVAARPTRLWRRPLALAVLVLVAGAALGAAGFAAEQHSFVWRPSVSATSDGGWRITGSAGLRPVAPVIAGDRLVWGQGAYTCVLDLGSGETHVVGVAPHGTSIWPPSAGERYVAWIESPKANGVRATLWVYDTRRGRRQSFAVGPDAATTAVSGDVVVWFDLGPDGIPRVVALDMDSSRRSILAEGPEIDYPVLADDGVVGWLERGASGSAPSVVLKDMEKGAATTVPLATDGSGLSVGDIQLGGRALLWTLQSSTTTRLVAFDLDTGATTIVAQGLIENPAIDGTVVLWTTGEGASGSCVVRGRRLDGGAEFDVGRPAAWPQSLAVGSGWAVWAFDEGTWTYLETARLGQ